MKLESGTIYPAKVLFDQELPNQPEDFKTQTLFLREHCEGGPKCEGIVQLILPFTNLREKEAEVENPLYMGEVKICLEYKDRILTPREGKVLIYMDDAFSIGSYDAGYSCFKELLNLFRRGIQ